MFLLRRVRFGFLRRRPNRSVPVFAGALPLLFVGALWGADRPGDCDVRRPPVTMHGQRAGSRHNVVMSSIQCFRVVRPLPQFLSVGFPAFLLAADQGACFCM